ncbi:MAG: PLP-dependent aminotransferase family protein [Lachnospiraceae bacterium]|nr:PLP-dependent aminotransferase family protein [Lachnospiraceae bacterium]
MEKKGDKPLYEYIYECLRDDIRSGALKSGSKLPSRRQMSLDNGVAEITVANAYAQLVTEGYIESREKRGFFVSSDLDAFTQEIESLPEAKESEADEVSADRKGYRKADAPEEAVHSKCINLSVGSLPEESFPFDTWSKIVRRILTEERSECIKAPEARGMLRLREAIAGYLSRSRGFTPDPERIIVGPGTEYLSSILLNIIGRNAVVALEDPGYKNISNLYESSPHECVHVPVDENGMITDTLSENNVKMVHVSPSHQFPMGCVMSAARRASLIHWANAGQAWIAEDDYDSEYRFEGRPVPPLIASDPGRVIYMNTFSKTLSPSIRISYMILPDELYSGYVKKHIFQSGSVSSLEQLTLASFISEGYYERHLNRTRNMYRKRKKAIFDIVQGGELSGLFDLEGDGSGMTFLLHSKKHVDDKVFLDSIRKRGVRLNSLADYCYNSFDFARDRYVVNFSSVTEEQFLYAAHVISESVRG